MSPALHVSRAGVMFGIRPSPDGFGAPASHRDRSSPPNAFRGVWHSPQWASASARYRPCSISGVGAGITQSGPAKRSFHAPTPARIEYGNDSSCGWLGAGLAGSVSRKAASETRSSIVALP